MISDRYKLSQFYKGKDFEIDYFEVKQFDDKNINTENLKIQTLSFLFNTLKEKEKLDVQKKWIDILPNLDKVKRLHISCGINQELFDALNDIPSLEELIIISSKATDLSKLTKIKNLKRLEIENFTQLKDISILEDINLLQLRIENCFKIENYEVAGRIKSLLGLSLNGYCWGPKNLKIQSIKSFARLENLKHLDLSTTSIVDKNSILSILEIKSLERFDLTGSFKPEIVENIKQNHPNLLAGFFVDWDYKNKRIYDGKTW